MELSNKILKITAPLTTKRHLSTTNSMTSYDLTKNIDTKTEKHEKKNKKREVIHNTAIENVKRLTEPAEQYIAENQNE